MHRSALSLRSTRPDIQGKDDAGATVGGELPCHTLRDSYDVALMTARYRPEFDAQLIRYPGKGGWHFAPIPDAFAPPVTHGWGRTPVHATVDGHSWKTSVWRGKDGRPLLAVPKRVRGTKGDGDRVRVRLEFNVL